MLICVPLHTLIALPLPNSEGHQQFRHFESTIFWYMNLENCDTSTGPKVGPKVQALK